MMQHISNHCTGTNANFRKHRALQTGEDYTNTKADEKYKKVRESLTEGEKLRNSSYYCPDLGKSRFLSSQRFGIDEIKFRYTVLTTFPVELNTK